LQKLLSGRELSHLFTVSNKTYYTYYTAHISKIHKTQFNSCDVGAEKAILQSKEEHEGRSVLEGGWGLEVDRRRGR
jgi:hypothetical protein